MGRLISMSSQMFWPATDTAHAPCKAPAHKVILCRVQTGFYCIYKRRTAGQMNYNAANEGSYQTYTKQPDCTNISE